MRIVYILFAIFGWSLFLSVQSRRYDSEIMLESDIAKNSPASEDKIEITTNAQTFDYSTEGLVQWVVGEAGQNPTPDNAVECGYDGDYTTYVARAVHNGIDVPGKLVPENNNEMHIPFHRKELRKDNFEILVSSNVEWKQTINNAIPSNAVIGGYTSTQSPLFISRAHVGHRLICGTVDSCTKRALIPFNGTALRFDLGDYEVLVYSSEIILKVTTTVGPTTPLPIYSGVLWVNGTKSERFLDDDIINCGNDDVIIARALHKGKYIPGKLIRGYPDNFMFITSNGEEHHKYYFQILISKDVEWIQGTGKDIPPNAIIGGHSVNNTPLYIGRTRMDYDGISCGKVDPKIGAALVPYQGDEFLMTNYEILVLKTKLQN